MDQAKTRNEIKEARAILKPVRKAEKRLKKAADALVVAKLALAHALVEAHVASNAMLSAWTEAVLSGDEAAVQKVYAQLAGKTDKTDKRTTKKSSAELKLIPGHAAPVSPPAAAARKTPAPRARTAASDPPPAPAKSAAATKGTAIKSAPGKGAAIKDDAKAHAKTNGKAGPVRTGGTTTKQ